jgi:uncharacterized repeat protein (TIGR02543 family)
VAGGKTLVLPLFFLLPAMQGQYAQLGPAPVAPEPLAPSKVAEQPRFTHAGNWYDTNDRAAIRDVYNNTFAPTNSVNMGFTGNTSSCNAGTVSQAWYTAVTTRLNWFRGMAGVPMGITLNGVWNNKDQQAALMMSRNQALNHTPPNNWLCYTADGYEAAGKSNLCYLSGYGNTDPGCVALYMRDDGSNNAAVGHRRWIIYPQSTAMGTGDIAESSYPRTNALWVIDNATIGNPRPTTRDTFVAWPPKGYVPYAVIPSRWSLSYPGANFSGASVSMTRNGVNVSVTLEPVSNGYGENTLVWIPTMAGGNPGSDATVNVTVNNVVLGGTPQSFNYQTIIFDPAVASGSTVNVTINTSPQGRSITVDSANYTAPQVFNWTPGTQHTINVPSPQTSGGTRYVYASWSHGGSQSQSIQTPSSDSAYTANFNTEYLLTASVSPGGTGQVAADPPSQSGYYASGQPVQLNATPNTGYQFNSWSGDLTGTVNPQNVTMNGPRSIAANFTPTSSATAVTIGTNPPGLSVTVDGATFTAPQTFQWNPNSAHIISTPSPQGSGSTRYSFNNWSDLGAQTHTINTPASPVTITASFTTEHLLTILRSPPSGGAVNAVPPSASGFYAQGTGIQLTASPSAGFQFSGWTGDLTGSQNPGQILMNAARTVTANFNAISGCAYSLNKPGTSISALGDIVKFELDTTSDCAWSVTAPDAWISITTAASGSGKTVVRFIAAANASTGPRTGTLLIAGLTHTVFQAAAGCSFGIVNQASGFSSAAGALNLQVNTGAGCAWTPFPAPSWLTLTSPAGNTGSGAANFDFGSNGGSMPRPASVSAGGQVAHVMQKPASPVQWFQDVALSHPFVDHITLLRLNNVTLGCSANDYCPDATTTRGQMAAFIIRSLFGESFSFSGTPYFTDVPASHPFFKYAQKMRESGITAGCSATTYCPDSPVTREQMAAFLIRARLGVSPTESFPVTATPHFLDVSPVNPFFAYIQKMKDLGITSGCGASQYCPGDPTTRGQMAVFLIRAFFTP